MPRHDRAYGVYHSTKSKGASKAKRPRGRSNYPKRLAARRGGSHATSVWKYAAGATEA